MTLCDLYARASDEAERDLLMLRIEKINSQRKVVDRDHREMIGRLRRFSAKILVLDRATAREASVSLLRLLHEINSSSFGKKEAMEVARALWARKRVLEERGKKES